VYRSIAEEEYVKARGNIGLARRWAIAELKSRYGASRLSGRPVVMEMPPESTYPAIDGGWDYLQALALQQERSADPAAQEILLVSDSTTITDRNARQAPRYALWHRSTEGEWSLAATPFSVAPDRLAALQQRANEERRSRAAAVVARAREIQDGTGSLARHV
jgi:hypothetical protein